MQDMQESLASLENKDGSANEPETNTMVRLPEATLRRAKATAALRGETLKQFMAVALEERVERLTGK